MTITPTSESSLGGEPVYFDPDGELHLEVGPQKVVHVVCPRSLARASPVFKRMLYGRFAEAKPATGDWRVALPEDNPEALKLLLNIIHSHFAKVPNNIRQIELYEATVLTNKYDLTHILQPWVQQWLQNLEHGLFTPRVGACRIWIAWELGDLKLFISEADFLLRYCSLNADGDLVDHTATPLHIFVMLRNLGILEKLEETRFKTIQSLISPVNHLFESLLGRGVPRPISCSNMCTSKEERDTCAAIVLASFVKALAAADLFPLPPPEDYVGKPEDLYLVIRKVSNGITAHQRSLYHDSCSPKKELMEKIEQAYRNRSVIYDETHLAHVEMQAKKTGMS